MILGCHQGGYRATYQAQQPERHDLSGFLSLTFQEAKAKYSDGGGTFIFCTENTDLRAGAPWGSLSETGSRAIEKSLSNREGKNEREKAIPKDRMGNSSALGFCISSGKSKWLIYQESDSISAKSHMLHS